MKFDMSEKEEQEQIKEVLDEALRRMKRSGVKLEDAYELIGDAVGIYTADATPEDKKIHDTMSFAASMLYHKAFANRIPVAGLALFIAYMVAFLAENMAEMAVEGKENPEKTVTQALAN